jgi:hypothetical protein
LEVLGIDVSIILKWASKKGMNRLDLAEDRGRWQASVNAVMNLWFS